MLDMPESIHIISFASSLLKISKRAMVASLLIPIILVRMRHSTAPLWPWATPFLPQKSFCGGDNWELLENWTDSIDHYHQRMTAFARRVDGPLRVYFEGRRDHHSSCSLSAKLLEERDKIYRDCIVGLRLDVVGNHVYRTSDSSGNESK